LGFYLYTLTSVLGVDPWGGHVYINRGGMLFSKPVLI
jgi:hypothetical protein